jgi:hypothetical protein
MITLSRVKAATSEFIKVLRYGKNDVQTCEPIMLPGIDSKPINEDIAIHSTTGESSDPICLGYIWKSELTKEGEIRIFSRDANGVEQIYIHLKNDGTIEFGGDTDNLVRFSKIDKGLQDFKDLIVTELGKISAGISGVGGTYAPGSISVNISDAKIEEFKSI